LGISIKYAATVQRIHCYAENDAAMTRAPTLDIHAHILPEQTIRRLGKEAPRLAPRLVEQSDGSTVMEIAGKVVQQPMPRQCWDLDLRLADMDAYGIDRQAICATVHTFFYDQEPALGRACAILQNDEIAAVAKRHPDRFVALATLPLQDPQRAADELTRAMRVLGLRGAQIGTHVNGSNLDDPALEPVWAAANALKAFILVHPHGEILPGDRLKSYYMRNFVGLPFETTMAGAALVFGGVIERHPDVSFCLCHGGGFLPYQAGRLLHAFDVRAEPRRRLRGSPQDSLARLHYDTIVHSPRALEFLIAAAGPQRVLMGSDYPFDMGEFDCVARVNALAISQTDRDAVRGRRAGELLGDVRPPQL
jgi:aminocarboxymuconate-semialdehyde decarboxylase